MSIAMLGVTKSFLDDRLSITLNGIVPISKDFKMHMNASSTGSGFTTNMGTTIQMAQVALQVSWSFGKQGSQKTRQVRRTIENEEQLNSSTTAESMSSIMMQ